MVTPAGTGDFVPHLARAARALPNHAPRLAGDGDEAEIADGGAIGPHIPIEHDHTLAQTCSRQGMRQADNACADDSEVV